MFLYLSSPPIPVHILTNLSTLHYSQHPFAQLFDKSFCTKDEIHISWHLESSVVSPLSISLILNPTSCLHRLSYLAKFVCWVFFNHCIKYYSLIYLFNKCFWPLNYVLDMLLVIVNIVVDRYRTFLFHQYFEVTAHWKS